MRNSSTNTAAAVMWAAALLAGCSVIQPMPPEEAVANRAEEHAALLMAGDFKRALTYMTPSFQQGGRANFYMADKVGALNWQKAELKWVQCDDVPDPDRCEVRFIIHTTRPPAVTYTLTVPLDDTWLLIDGEWYQYADT